MKSKKEVACTARAIRNFYLFVIGFLALGALGGGIVLMLSPDGAMMGLPVSTFKNMPFDSFMIPGIILFCVLGLIPSLLIIALIKKPASMMAERFNIFHDMYWAWTFSVYIAFTLIGWIHIQLIFLQGAVYWLHTFYMFYAIFMIIIALLPPLRSLYRKKEASRLN